MNAPDPTDRTPPHNIRTEQAVLGSMLLSDHAAVRITGIIGAGDFYRPAHELIYNAINWVRTNHGKTDAVLVGERLIETGEIVRIGGAPYLHTLAEVVPSPASGPAYARAVRGMAVRRRLIEAGLHVAQLGWATDTDNDGNVVSGLAQRAIADLEAVRDYGIGDDAATALDLHEFLAVEDDEYDWIVPGLLERHDRLVITGQEGLGKSMLLRQMCVMIAAGLHPFTAQPIEPKRVMIIDAENSDTQTRRILRPLAAQAKLTGHPIPQGQFWIEPNVKGIDLAQDRSVSWLLQRLSVVKPDVLMIGPLYKLAPRALQTDDEAAPVLAALDLVRDQGICLLMEAHAGHSVGGAGKRDMRPRGSAALMGWPEFGKGLRVSDDAPSAPGRRRADLVAWRGDRDERDWPEVLESGGKWPWSIPWPGGSAPTNPYAQGGAR